MSALPRYAPSGKVKPIGFALIAGAAVAGAIVGAIYQLLVRVDPYIQLKVFTVIFAGLGLALIAKQAIRAGHVRNRLVALAIVLVTAVSGLAASFYTDYRWDLSEVARRFPDEASEILPFSRYLSIKQQYGWKMKDGGSVTGGGVLAIWTVEALLLFGFTAIGMIGVRDPYCEACGEWCTHGKFAVTGLGRAAADPLIKDGALDRVLELSSGSGNAQTALTFTVTTCPRCTQTAFLSVDESITTTTKKKTSTRSTSLLRHAILSPPLREVAVERLTAAVGQRLPAVSAR